LLKPKRLNLQEGKSQKASPVGFEPNSVGTTLEKRRSHKKTLNIFELLKEKIR
jgi:hypothetical protein